MNLIIALSFHLITFRCRLNFQFWANLLLTVVKYLNVYSSYLSQCILNNECMHTSHHRSWSHVNLNVRAKWGWILVIWMHACISNNFDMVTPFFLVHMQVGCARSGLWRHKQAPWVIWESWISRANNLGRWRILYFVYRANTNGARTNESNKYIYVWRKRWGKKKKESI